MNKDGHYVPLCVTRITEIKRIDVHKKGTLGSGLSFKVRHFRKIKMWYNLIKPPQCFFKFMSKRKRMLCSERVAYSRKRCIFVTSLVENTFYACLRLQAHFVEHK